MSARSRYTAAMIGVVWLAYFLFDLAIPQHHGWIDSVCLILEASIAVGFFAVAIFVRPYR